MKYTFLFLLFNCLITHAQLSDFKHIDFTRADNLAKLNQGASLSNLPVLTHKLTAQLPSDVEKLRAIYTWVCLNIKGDPNQHNLVTKKRKQFGNDSLAYFRWNNEFKTIAFKKLLNKKETMCTGYAYLIKEMCFLANIKSEIINGYARTADSNVKKLDDVNHSWNAVKLNNKWYLCDATWSSGYMISGVIFVKDYNDGYFLAEPELFAKSHYPFEKKWLLNDCLIHSDFVAGPLVYEETFKHHVIPISPEKMQIEIPKSTIINFSFKSEENIGFDQVDLVKLVRKNEKELKIYDMKTENGIIKFKCLFKHRGLQDVHLRINDDIVATYTVNVTKT